MICALILLTACAGSGGRNPDSSAPLAARASLSPTDATTPAAQPASAPIAATARPVDPAVLPVGTALETPGSLNQVGGYRLQMQDDGDLVLTWGTTTVLWRTATSGHPGSRAVLQPDGDFVVADPGGSVLWSAGTAGSGAVQVGLTSSGELSIEAPAGAVWAAGSDGHRGRIDSVVDAAAGLGLCMQDDGNFVLYAAGTPVWATMTSGNPGAIAELQPDGNLVIIAANSSVIWNSGTAGSGATKLVVTNGNVELQDAAGARVWQAVAPVPVAVPTPTTRAPAAPRTPTASGVTGLPAATAPAAEKPPAAAPPATNDYGLAGSLIAEINAYRQQNGLSTLQVSSELNGYAASCAAGMATSDAPLAHCRSGEIVQYNTYSSPHAWLLAYQNSPAHNAIMLTADIKYIGGGVSLSPNGRYYSVINVAY